MRKVKRVNNIYEKICNKENIKKGILKASLGKKSRKNVARVVNNIDEYVDILHNMIINNQVQLSPYKKVKILDGANQKERTIYKPAFFPDQCIHWCLMLQIEPIISRGMYEFCCASVPGRGLHYGAKHIKKILVDDRKNTKYCLKLDIHHFYPSINQEICKQKFRKIIKDKETLNLIDIIIDSGESGLPIGNYTSQWFANFFLQDLDHYIKQDLKVKYYFRYMDDMVLFHRNKKELHKIKFAVEDYLRKEDLELKDNWQLFKIDSRPLDFLGFRFYRGHTTMRRTIFLRMKRRIKKIYKKDRITPADAHAVVSYHGWILHSNSYKVQKKYIDPYINLKICKEVIKNGRTKYNYRKQFEARKIHNRKHT